jgi:hypothetical protein
MGRRIRSNPALTALASLVTGLLLAAGAGAQTQAAAAPAPPAPPIVSDTLEPAVETSRGAKAFDALVLRPLGFAALPIGVAFFIPAAAITAPNGRESVEQALELFVTTPANYVFSRPLGEF